jgi:predicted TIM-barrel fold metal-dependent hydrolase
MIELAVDLLGSERVVYGSDAPGSGFLPNLGKIASSTVDDPDKAKILSGNMERIISRRSGS